MKKVITKDKFRELLTDNMSIMVGGFMAVGTNESLIDEIVAANVKGLTIICNDAGFETKGVGKLIKNGQVKKLIASHIGLNPEAGRKMSDGSMECVLVPQGTLAEQIRAGGAGLGGVLTKTGLNTIVAEGKEVITVQGVDYLLEEPIKADLAIINGHTVDEWGNVVYNKTATNFNPIMATACETVVVGAEHLVALGDINPDVVNTPHIFVDYIVKEEN
jgi:acetate CoA/acetoacetate CoA-transferase alpha subunit